jgi:hypothetical protein
VVEHGSGIIFERLTGFYRRLSSFASFLSSASLFFLRLAGRAADGLAQVLGGGLITSSSNLTRLRNEATDLRNRQEFQPRQLTELTNTDFESWARESFEIATKIACRNGGRIGVPRARSMDCTMVAVTPVPPVGYFSFLFE